MDGQQPVRSPNIDAIARLAKWWQAASQEERFRLYAASIAGFTEAPPLKTLQIASIWAEAEAGEISEG